MKKYFFFVSFISILILLFIFGFSTEKNKNNKCNSAGYVYKYIENDGQYIITINNIEKLDTIDVLINVNTKKIKKL